MHAGPQCEPSSIFVPEQRWDPLRSRAMAVGNIVVVAVVVAAAAALSWQS